MNAYLDLLRHIQANGETREDRTGVGTTGVFGHQFRHDLANGFPLLTTKRMSFKIVVAELLWMLSGSTNVRPLQGQGVTIWVEWASENGELGPVYGKQWRNWVGSNNYSRVWDENHTAKLAHVDQIARLVNDLKGNPFSRRHLVTAWNPAEIYDMALPACHFVFQCHVSTGKRLSLHANMRSADAFLGVPYNIAFYALLTHVLANLCGYQPGDLVMSFGDLHIYRTHGEAVSTQLARTPAQLPALRVNRQLTSIDTLRIEDFTLEDYHPQPAIKAPVAV